MASPVMSETLSVIDEHIKMNAPPATFTNGNKRHSTGGRSAVTRLSYIAGHESDEETHELHTEEEVLAWSPARVAEYLEDHGVEKAHVEVFKEQEISGEVLLAMEQSSIFLKEFDLGSVGRRLKTWHKVRTLQDELRQGKRPDVLRPSSSHSSHGLDGNESTGRKRSSTVASALPPALDTTRQPALPDMPATGTLLSYQQNAASSTTALPSYPSPRPENTDRPSAQNIRQMMHHRHSSVDADSATNSIDSPTRQGHRKLPSFDRTWQPGQAQSTGLPMGHSKTLSSESVFAKRSSTMFDFSSARDYGRDDFKSSTPGTQRSPSKRISDTAEGLVQARGSTMAARRATSSARSSSNGMFRDSTNPSVSAGLFDSFNAVGNAFSNARSITSPQLGRKSVTSMQATSSPVVTKLEYASRSTDKLNLSPATVESSDRQSTGRAASASNGNKLAFFSSRKSKANGLRAISDAITNKEKLVATVPPSIKESDISSPTRTGSTTPSSQSKSIDIQKSEAQSYVSADSGGNFQPTPVVQHKIKTKTKNMTSAYTRGLLSKPPAEQMLDCDYSGWMKKKSGSLMTTWKPRLFILRGRRLSYYYADTDNEEKGLIDISFHRVLPAHNETLTGLHATVTGAASNTTSNPREGGGSIAGPTAAEQDLAASPHLQESNDGLFIFKLVPPKAGMAKGVSFTKPTVHYFAVNSRQEGRLWMAALMKATIDRDEDSMVTTSYNQKTISLAKARARRERPPALQEDPPQQRLGQDRRGLGIEGLDDRGDAAAVGGAERDRGEDTSSFAPSTVATGDESLAVGEELTGVAT